MAAAVGSAVLDVIERERLAEQAERVGAYLRARLAEVAAAHPVVREVRGPGLFVGVELDCDAPAQSPIGRAVANGLRRRGVLVGATGPRLERDQDPPAARLLGSARRPRRGSSRRDPRHRTAMIPR